MDFILLTVGDTIDKVFYGFDIAVFKFFAAIESSFLTGVAKLFTSFGDENFVIPMVILGIVLMLFKKTRKYGFALVFSIIVGTLITNVIVKPTFLRIRPYNTLQGVDFYQAAYFAVGGLSESDYSFPSGHTTGAFEIAVSMFLVFRSEGKKKISWIFPAVALCTMGSRVYLMVHYPTDVLGGMNSVRIAFGTVVSELKEVSKSYKEAKLALEVGRVFYAQKDTISYGKLGIGRLIYQLPMSLCEMFIKEVFGDKVPEILDDEEAMSTINKFFENSLNISETARQLYVHRNTLVYRLERIQKAIGLDIRNFDDAMTFRIAVMVISHMRSQSRI